MRKSYLIVNFVASKPSQCTNNKKICDADLWLFTSDEQRADTDLAGDQDYYRQTDQP